MVPSTARPKSTTKRAVRLRACSWASKKSMNGVEGRVSRVELRGLAAFDPRHSTFALIEADLRRLALGLIFNLEKLGRREAEHAGEGHIGEGLARGIVAHDGVVIGLAGEGNLVLGRCELFGALP